MSRRYQPTMGARTWLEIPHTEAVRRVLDTMHDHTATEDFLFLEAWETRTMPDVSATLRAHQIRRANPLLAAELRAELQCGRPLTAEERRALAAHLG